MSCRLSLRSSLNDLDGISEFLGDGGKSFNTNFPWQIISPNHVLDHFFFHRFDAKPVNCLNIFFVSF